MDIRPTVLPEIKLVSPRRFGDARGWFRETYSRAVWRDSGIDIEFVQDNHSYSARAGTIRGLHFQTAPAGQAKLILVARGAVLDVVVDIRRSSPRFGRHVAVELSAENGLELLIPEGFAHGVCTLAPDTELMYKVSRSYSPAHDTGIRWNDPALGIVWPFQGAAAVVSDKDRNLPLLADSQELFP